ncbi:MAG: glycosyltransferase family 8 protein [Cyanobium sp.]
MNIVCATDGNYLPHCVAMLQSLWQHNQKQSLRVFLIFADTSPSVLAQAIGFLHQFLPSLSVLEACAEPLQGFPVSGHATVATYFRLLLPELLPASIDRVIFIDADTVVTDSLLKLWEQTLAGKALAAVPEHRLSCADHGYTYGKYFNAGIMLVDLERWRQSSLLERGRRFAQRHPDRLRHWDQDVLNHVFADAWLPIGDRWNACPHLFGLTGGYDLSAKTLSEPEREAIESPAIIHFAGPGPVKPWNARCKHPLRHHYLHAKALTPWASTPLDDRPPPLWQRRLAALLFTTKCWLKSLVR